MTNSFIFHSRGWRGENFDACGTKLRFERGCGACREIEVNSAGALVFDERVGLGDVHLGIAVREKAVTVVVLVGLREEAELAVEVHCAGEVFDWDDAGYG
jgi:hypothetical protein